MGRGGRRSRSSSRRRRRSTTCSRSRARAARGFGPSRGGRARGRPAVGCRRAGGGLAARRSRSNVLAGARLAAQLDPELARLRRQRRRAAARRGRRADPRHERRSRTRAGLNAYRVLVSDLVVDTGGADRDAIRSISDVPVVAAKLRLRPAEPLAAGAPPCSRPARRRRRARRRGRPRLPQPRATEALREELEQVDAEVYLVELKAAAVDVVAEAALARGAEVVLAANDVVSRARRAATERRPSRAPRPTARRGAAR